MPLFGLSLMEDDRYQRATPAVSLMIVDRERETFFAAAVKTALIFISFFSFSIAAFACVSRAC